MKWIITICLLALLAMIHYEMWVGERGWHAAASLNQKLDKQMLENKSKEAKMDAIALQVKDLEEGKVVIEEAARAEYGYINKGEVYYRIVEK